MSNDIKPQPPMARVGRFLMLDMLGEGAFGKVRLAVDETSGMEYAIKIMDKNLIKAKELTLQVRREIAVMKAMRHGKFFKKKKSLIHLYSEYTFFPLFFLSRDFNVL